MILNTMGGPPPSTGQNKTLIAILIGCGSCTLITVIAIVIIGFLSARALKTVQSAMSGVMTMSTTMPKFLTDLENKDYTSCAGYIDPSVQSKFTAAKIKSMADSMEKKLGKLKSYSPQTGGQTTKTVRAANGKPTQSQLIYSYPLIYEKGTATATFTFVMDASTSNGDQPNLKMSGKIYDFKLQVDE